MPVGVSAVGASAGLGAAVRSDSGAVSVGAAVTPLSAQLEPQAATGAVGAAVGGGDGRAYVSGGHAFKATLAFACLRQLAPLKCSAVIEALPKVASRLYRRNFHQVYRFLNTGERDLSVP